MSCGPKVSQSDARKNASAVLSGAAAVISTALGDEDKRPNITAFFDLATNTASYVVCDPTTRHCAVVDSLLDYDAASGRTSTRSADSITSYVRDNQLEVQWILETHVHADHLSAAPYIKSALGGRLGIGANIRIVQDMFGKVFNAGTEFQRDGAQFDRLFIDGEPFGIGNLQAIAIDTPGHTPACMTYVIGNAAFVGDTLFMPDYGTARADFPGGDARVLYRSMRRLLALPEAARIFVCHDYKAPGRAHFQWETTVADERAHNIHVHDGVSEDEFVQLRTTRDAQLAMPKLILPSVQVNMRGGSFPPPESDGEVYLKIPLNKF